MRLREWFLNKRSHGGGTSHRSKPRNRAGLTVETLEGRELLSGGVHIPPMGLSGPGMGHVLPTSVGHPSTPGITVPPLGISHPSPSHVSAGLTLTGSNGGTIRGFHLVGSTSSFNSNGMMGNGMIGGMMMGGMMM